MKKLKNGFIFLAFLGISLVGCKKKNLTDIAKSNISAQSVNKSLISDEGETILGNQLENPFTTSNMIQAYTQLGGNGNLIQTNQLYVRFKITEVSEARSLEDRGLILSTTPLDYEIIQYGYYYNDPSLSDQIWMYSTVLPNFNFTGFQYEIIDELFLPSLTIGTGLYPTLFGNFDHEELVDEALTIKGHTDEVSEKAATKYRPKGYIRVQQKILSNVSNIAVKNIKVRTRWWFDIGTGYTDDNGYFQSNQTYKKKRKVNVICIFENQHTNIRGIKGLQFWDIFFTERKNIGKFQNSAMESINFTFQNSSDLNSDTKRKWMACHAINSIREFHTYATQNGIDTPPNALNTWLTNANSNGNSLSIDASAPMLKQLSNSSLLVNGVQLLLIGSGHPWFAVCIQVLEQFPPDITYNYSGANAAANNESDAITQTFYHEYAHASHFKKVGNPYWTSYISYIVQNLGYGNSQTSGSGRIAISEAWAEFCSARFAHLRYNNTTSISVTWLDYIEDFIPDAGFSSWNWTPDGVMHDLTDNSENTSTTNVIDKVSGFSISQCFGSMDADVISVPGYKNRFILEYGIAQQNDINMLFTSYGY